MLANHYHKIDSPQRRSAEPAALLAEIEQFLQNCSQPAVLEAGDEPIQLLPEQHRWEIKHNHLFFSAWPEERSVHRRLVGIETRKPGLMVCSVQRFGGATGRFNLIDLAHPRSANRLLRGDRRNFSEAFRRMLNRQFPGWRIQTLTTEMQLQRSFSPKFPRAVLEKGNFRMAAMACAAADDEHSFLSFALLWHHYVSGHSENHGQVPLALFLPDNAGSLTASRLKWLSVETRLFRFNKHGSAGEIDSADLGNMSSRLIGREPQSSSVNLPIPAKPESRLETAILGNIGIIDAALETQSVFRQVITFQAVDRDIVDLIAADSQGRIAVIELKAEEDIHLPLQALDYWMRINNQIQEGALDRFYPQLPISRQAPRLFLVAPAVQFHPSSETLLAYFHSQIETERVGLNLEWQQGLKVAFRLRGHEKPQSHRRLP